MQKVKNFFKKKFLVFGYARVNAQARAQKSNESVLMSRETHQFDENNVASVRALWEKNHQKWTKNEKNTQILKL